jgi:hypothetical protein
LPLCDATVDLMSVAAAVATAATSNNAAAIMLGMFAILQLGRGQHGAEARKAAGLSLSIADREALPVQERGRGSGT